MIAGPNGSGKSTLSEWVDLAGRGLLLDPDAIARAINPRLPRTAAIPAGREVLRLIKEYIGRRETFAVETTLSSYASLKLIEDTRDRGYEVHLIFVALESPERCIMRIQNRVVDGGHFIPDTDVRRRYYRSMANLPEAIRSVNKAKLYDNSVGKPRLVLRAEGGAVTFVSPELPGWVPAGLAS